jgi:NTE family protein
LVEGRRVAAFLRDIIGGAAIEDVTPVFGAVAAELTSGRELWLTAGSLVEAACASIALPGVMTPALLQGRWLIDGALVNPLPVSLCRALGADVIIGVSLNGSLFAPGLRCVRLSGLQVAPGEGSGWLRRLSFGRWGRRGASRMRVGPVRPGYLDVVTQAVFGAQDFISRVRMAADPVDVLIAPDAASIGLLDFHRGAEAIAAGRIATEAMAGTILDAWDTVQHQVAAE